MHRTYRWLAVIALSGIVLGGALPLAAQSATTPEDLCAAQTSPEPESRDFEQAADVLADGTDYWAVICTDAGPVVVDLFEQDSPITVNSFVFLAQNGYYNHTTFHRVLPGFMAQGGDPSGTGSGGPGYEFEDETSNGLLFDRSGLLAMANAGPNTNGSQFFITYAPTSWLDGAHTIFGEVVQGIESAELLRPRDPETYPEFDGAALNTVVVVTDPASLTLTPDDAPSLAHIQAVMEQNILSQINEQFVIDREYSHTYDLEAEAVSWEGYGAAAVDYLRAYLSDHGFQGSAAVLLNLAECPATAEEMPIWALSFQVYDYGTDGAAEAVVFDDARADQFKALGVFDTWSDPADVGGRVFSRALDPEAWCGPNGRYYRLEQPLGRYAAVVDMYFDADFINDASDPTAAQYLGYVMQDLMMNSVGGVLNRGTAAGG